MILIWLFYINVCGKLIDVGNKISKLSRPNCLYLRNNSVIEHNRFIKPINILNLRNTKVTNFSNRIEMHITTEGIFNISCYYINKRHTSELNQRVWFYNIDVGWCFRTQNKCLPHSTDCVSIDAIIKRPICTGYRKTITLRVNKTLNHLFKHNCL